MSVRSASRRSVDCRRTWLALLTALCAATAGAQYGRAVAVVTVAGRGPETYVLLTGLVGGVAGFRRGEWRVERVVRGGNKLSRSLRGRPRRRPRMPPSPLW